MAESCIIAFAPDDGYLYNSAKRWARKGMPKDIEDLFTQSKINDIKCVTFGDRKDCWFLNYINKDQEAKFLWGNGCPKEFIDYLMDPKTKACLRNKELQVVFGPGDSFVAWDTTSIRWSDIPKGLERVFQKWLTPAGWKCGPPRLVALGAKGSYMAISQYGAWAYYIDDNECPEISMVWARDGMDSWFQKREVAGISLSASHCDRFFVLKKDLCYAGDVAEPLDPFDNVMDSMVDEETQKLRKKVREDEKKAAEEAKKAEAEKKKAEAEQKKAETEKKRKEAEEKARREREEATQREVEEQRRITLSLQYALWRTKYEADIEMNKILTVFPHLPVAVCTCNDVSCQVRKDRQDSLRACQHDVEKLLRASGTYSLEWLRKERIMWHPDKFGRRCDPDFRKLLVGKATEMYAIFETLIASETGTTAWS